MVQSGGGLVVVFTPNSNERTNKQTKNKMTRTLNEIQTDIGSRNDTWQPQQQKIRHQSTMMMEKKMTTKFEVNEKDGECFDGEDTTNQQRQQEENEFVVDDDEEDYNDDDEFFGPQDSDHDYDDDDGDVDNDGDQEDQDVSTATKHNPFGRMGECELQSQYQRLYTVSYVDSFDASKESKLQDGFEHGYKQSFGIGQRIGRMLGHVSTAHQLSTKLNVQSQSPQQPSRAQLPDTVDDEDFDGQEEKNVRKKKKNIRQAGMLIRDFFDTGLATTTEQKKAKLPSPSVAVAAVMGKVDKEEQEGVTSSNDRQQQLLTNLNQLEEKIQKLLLPDDS